LTARKEFRLALYFNVFVLVAQVFEHLPGFHALAPTQTEGPFKIAQLLLLVVSRSLSVRPPGNPGRSWHNQTKGVTRSGIDTVQGSGEGDGFADVFKAADPRDSALDAHAEAGVRD
jgi:hypothetical protein